MNRFEEMIVCPYYRKSNGDEIICEGATEDSRNRITFTYSAFEDRKRARIEYLKKFCCGAYTDCLWKKTMDEKYK